MRKVAKMIEKLTNETAGQEVALRETATEVAESEHEAKMIAARRMPRDVRRCCAAMHVMASLNEMSAARMSYTLPRGGKSIVGPTVRFAEVVAQAWGNCDISV